jgi:membrane protease YdiL (CAAX protease family)
MKPRAIYSTEAAQGWLPWGALAPLLAIVFVAITALSVSSVLERFHLVDAMENPIGLPGLNAFLVFPFAALGLTVMAWVRWVERRPLATIGLVRPGARRFGRGMAIGIATASAVVAAIWIAGGYHAQGFAPALGSPMALLNIAVLLLSFALQSSVEEIVFRGWLMSVVARKFNVPLAIVLTSLVFTFLHYSRHQPWLVVSSSFLFSAFCCCWALKRGNIWGVMGWHAGWCSAFFAAAIAWMMWRLRGPRVAMDSNRAVESPSAS